ncbi:hypothetical protein Tco_0010687 [Tanacetum coccineum]
MAPKRAARSNIAPETTNTTSITNAQLQAMINQGVTAALAARDANTNGVDNHNSRTGARRNKRATCECTYPDFMKCQPLNFKGTEGVVKLTQWIKKMETVTIGNDIAYAMTWTELKKKITDKYYPRTEIKKLEVELGLPDMIHGSVVTSKPKTMQEATKMAIEVMDKTIRTFVDRQIESKRKFEDTSRNTQNQPQHNKRQNTGRAYTAGSGNKKQYGIQNPYVKMQLLPRWLSMCSKMPQNEQVGHFARDCRSTANANNVNHQRGTGSEDKSEKKRLEDIAIVLDFPDVFPEDLPSRAPYRLAPSEMKELSEQLKELSDKGLYRTSFLHPGGSGLVCQEEGRIVSKCINYRELNKLTVKNRYPLSRIDDLFDQL